MNTLRIKVGYRYCKVLEGPRRKVAAWLTAQDPTKLFELRRTGESEETANVCFFDHDKRRFPAGFLKRVIRRAERAGYTIELIRHDADLIPASAVRPDMLHNVVLRDYQLEAVREFFKHECGAIQHATNAGKTPVTATVAMVLHEQFEDVRGLIMVPNKTLVNRTTKELTAMCAGQIHFAQFGGGRKSVGQVTVATAQSLIKGCPAYIDARNARIQMENRALARRGKSPKPLLRLDRRLYDVLHNADYLIVDEAHHSSAATWQQILMSTRARWRLALSGTLRSPQERGKYRNFVLEGFVGPVLHVVRNAELIEAEHSARPVVCILTDPALYRTSHHVPRGLMDPIKRYQKEAFGLAGDKRYNRSLSRLMAAAADGGIKPCVLTTLLDHVDVLTAACRNHNLTTCVASGKSSNAQRDAVITRYSHDPRAVLIGSTIFDEGVNIPVMGALFMGQGSGYSYERLLQRVGRALRQKRDGVNYALIVDCLPTNGEFLERHARERIRMYEAEGFEVRYIDNVDDFAERLKRGWRGILGGKLYESALSKQKTS